VPPFSSIETLQFEVSISTDAISNYLESAEKEGSFNAPAIISGVLLVILFLAALFVWKSHSEKIKRREERKRKAFYEKWESQMEMEQLEKEWERLKGLKEELKKGVGRSTVSREDQQTEEFVQEQARKHSDFEMKKLHLFSLEGSKKDELPFEKVFPFDAVNNSQATECQLASQTIIEMAKDANTEDDE